jgi:hypothetical protein
MNELKLVAVSIVKIKLVATLMLVTLLAGMADAQVKTSIDNLETVTLFKNVKVFNGLENKLLDVDVLVVKNKIHKIAKDIPTSGTWEVDVRTGGAKQIKGPTGGLEAYTLNTF